MPVTLQLSFLYAVGFGGFVAFSVYLPTYLKDTFALTPGDAALRTAGFVVLAVIARPIGGWLSDRLHPVPVLVVCFAVVAVFAAVSALKQPLAPIGTVAFLAMAAALGAAAGAVFALVAIAAPADKVGAVTGIVGAAGGLGGFVPPLVMGAVYGWTGNYGPGLWLLAVTALVAVAYTAVGMRTVGRPTVAESAAH
jgi:NNP family nitrate/nitrite transporter-like MFS transporter